MPFEPRLFSGADGNLDGSNLSGCPGHGAGFDRSAYVDPAVGESAVRGSAQPASAALRADGASMPSPIGFSSATASSASASPLKAPRGTSSWLRTS